MNVFGVVFRHEEVDVVHLVLTSCAHLMIDFMNTRCVDAPLTINNCQLTAKVKLRFCTKYSISLILLYECTIKEAE